MEKPPVRLKFRIRYLLLPIVIAVLSLIMGGIFYAQLPEATAYHLTDGVADKWAHPATVTASLLVPQLLLLLLAFGITAVFILLARRAGPEASPVVGKMLALMGNMVALPQLVLGFAMANVISYNLTGAEVMPLWIFTVAVMAAGAVGVTIVMVLASKSGR